jgi:hypothetical protein
MKAQPSVEKILNFKIICNEKNYSKFNNPSLPPPTPPLLHYPTLKKIHNLPEPSVSSRLLSHPQFTSSRVPLLLI